MVGEKNAAGAPDLAIEVLSHRAGRRDEVLKRRLYERTSVPEYWIVDPDLEAVKVYRLVEGRYEKSAELSLEQGDSLSTPVLPGCSLALTRLRAALSLVRVLQH